MSEAGAHSLSLIPGPRRTAASSRFLALQASFRSARYNANAPMSHGYQQSTSALVTGSAIAKYLPDFALFRPKL